MNKTLHTLLLAIILQSCSYYTLYTGQEKKKSITDIPLQPHTHNVDVFFNDDKPVMPYYKVLVIDTVATEKASYEELLANLKLKAKHVGADGLIILEKDDAVSYSPVSQRTGSRSRYSTSTVTTQDAIPYQRIAAIGIKYAANIDYMQTIVKQALITVYDSTSTKAVALNFDFYGNVVADKTDEFSDHFYWENIEPFDAAAHLQSNVQGWEYTYDEFQKVKGFRRKKGESVSIDAKIQLQVYKDVYNINYKFYFDNGLKFYAYLLRFSTDNQGHIIEKRLYRKNEMLWKETIERYGETVKGYSRFGYVNGQEKLLFKATNSFFTKDDLPPPFTKE